MTTDRGNEIMEGNRLIAEFMGIQPEIEYCVGKEDSYCFCPKNVGNYFPDAGRQKKECERWLQEQHEKFPKGWVATSGYGVVKLEWYPFFERDWNELMEVVDKINEINNQADIQLSKSINEKNPKILYLRMAGPTINHVWQSVIEFIEWYNALPH